MTKNTYLLLGFLLISFIWIIVAIIAHLVKAKDQNTEALDNVFSDLEFACFFAILLIGLLELIDLV